jgi:hypothetical protein
MTSTAPFSTSSLHELITAAAAKRERGYGVVTAQNQRYWYKFGSHAEMQQEEAGYKTISGHYPTPRLLKTLDLPASKMALVFEHLPEVSDSAGLLADYTNTPEEVAEFFEPFAEHLANVFRTTLARRHEGASSDFFYRDRIAPRLIGFYDDDFLRKYSGSYTVNEHNCDLDLMALKQELLTYFDGVRVLPTVLCQADLNDRNITAAGEVLDYVGGGYNPIMAEWAYFYVYQLVLGPVIAPTYQAPVYRGCAQHHLQITDRSIKYKPGGARPWLIQSFYDTVIVGAIDTKTYPESLEHFKIYTAMRILTIFDLRHFSEQHRILMLGLLARVLAAESFEELCHDIY